jgi:murein tripeptide amidase MpaA
VPETTWDPAHFHTYDELTALLGGWAEAYPGLMSVASVGTSHEGRAIWCATVTNHTSVPASEKPALYVDGNMHAGEVTGCAVALATIHHLLTNYGADPGVTALLDTRTLYILPRVNPDGAERYLTTPYTLRSSVRPWPEAELDEGLTPEDLDGDGRILTMRVPDAKGEWKISERDARLMVKRTPGDSGGQYYRLYTEGRLHEYVRGPVKIARPLEGLDINVLNTQCRCYPAATALPL